MSTDIPVEILEKHPEYKYHQLSKPLLYFSYFIVIGGFLLITHLTKKSLI